LRRTSAAGFGSVQLGFFNTLNSLARIVLVACL